MFLAKYKEREVAQDLSLYRLDMQSKSQVKWLHFELYFVLQLEFLSISSLSFVSDLGPKGL